jgi:hypothetical protein
MTEKKKTCFIIMPISTPEPFLDKYRDGAQHFAHVLECLLIPGVKEAGYEAIPPTAKGSDLIQAGIIRNLEESDLVLCDMSCLNPNVLFEFGIRTSLNKPVCIVKDELTEKVPFDTAILNYHQYRGTIEPWELTEEIRKLAEHIKAAEERSKGENMLWKYFGLRTTAQPYAGESGMESKIDYLTLQINSLRQQVGKNPSRSERHSAEQEYDDHLRAYEYVDRMLPPGVTVSGFYPNAPNTDGGYRLVYKGHIGIKQKWTITANFQKQYGVGLSFEELDSTETKDSSE